jgi:ABC-type dipeptide/oligopeptide/nickel transport system permease subunit
MTIGAQSVIGTAPREGSPQADAIQSMPSIEGRSPWALAWSRLRRDRVAMASLAVIVLIILIAIFAPLVAALIGHPVNQQYRDTGLSPEGLPQPPSSEFPFGTDDLGRDIAVRIAYGARISLLVGVVATMLTVITGVVVGLVAGFFGGWADTILARLIDVVLSIPFLLVAIALVAVTGPSLLVTVLVIGFFSWASVGPHCTRTGDLAARARVRRCRTLARIQQRTHHVHRHLARTCSRR